MLILGLFASKATLAQSKPCPLPCPPVPCYTYNIVNNLDCQLELHSDYFWGPECPTLNGGIWFTVIIPAHDIGIYAPIQRKFGCESCTHYCGDNPNSCITCRCPTHMRVKNWSGPGYLPWAYTDPNYSGPAYSVPPGSSGLPSFYDCNGTPVYVKFDSATNTMTFDYIP